MNAQHVPQSNVQEVVRSLTMMTECDLGGEELLSVLRTFLARADDLRNIARRSGDSFKDMIEGRAPITQEQVNADALEAVYEVACLRWFLVHAFRAVAEHLERDVSQTFANSGKILSVSYEDDGSVESYHLA